MNNNVTAIKRSACSKRDTITRDALLNLSRLHLSQQATERQHAENAKQNIDLDSQPTSDNNLSNNNKRP
jgi:hypothetical protein